MDRFTEFLAKEFAGVISTGQHDADSVGCALEVWSKYEGLAWTDDPAVLNMPDLRPLNDGPWSSDLARTTALAPVLVAVAPVWRDPVRREAWVRAIVLETVRQILPITLRANGLTVEADRCVAVTDLVGAAEAARAAWAAEAAAAEAARAARAARAAWAAEAAARAAWAAEAAAWAAEAAEAAARAARAAAADQVLMRACHVWIAATTTS